LNFEDEIMILKRRLLVMDEVMHAAFELIVIHNPDMRDAVMARMAAITEHFQGLRSISDTQQAPERSDLSVGPNLYLVK
jgi:hypothetical protein